MFHFFPTEGVSIAQVKTGAYIYIRAFDVGVMKGSIIITPKLQRYVLPGVWHHTVPTVRINRRNFQKGIWKEPPFQQDFSGKEFIFLGACLKGIVGKFCPCIF